MKRTLICAAAALSAASVIAATLLWVQVNTIDEPQWYEAETINESPRIRVSARFAPRDRGTMNQRIKEYLEQNDIEHRIGLDFLVGRTYVFSVEDHRTATIFASLDHGDGILSPNYKQWPMVLDLPELPQRNIYEFVLTTREMRPAPNLVRAATAATVFAFLAITTGVCIASKE